MQFLRTIPTSSSSVLKEDNSCIAWLDKQTPKSVIYVSVGSVVFMQEKELVEMVWGLASSKQPFLWVLRTDFPDGIRTQKNTVGDRDCIVK